MPAGLWSSDRHSWSGLATGLFDAWSGKSQDSHESCGFSNEGLVGEIECYSDAASVATLK